MKVHRMLRGLARRRLAFAGQSKAGGYVGTVQDVTALRGAQEALRRAEEQLRAAFEVAPSGMALVALDGRLQRVNPALCRITGYSRAELEGLHMADITHPEDHERDRLALRALSAKRSDSHHAETRFVAPTGHTMWTALSATVVRASEAEPEQYLVQIQDVTDRHRYEERLQHMADHDPLTGLLNRRSFERELDRHVATVRRYGSQGAVLWLDLDHFKAVNDTLGHHAGDKLIVEIAQRLQERLRATDIIARLGGDEFAVLLPYVTRDEAAAVAEDLVALVRSQIVPGAERPRRVTASLGLVIVEGGEEPTGEELLVSADLAMYDAKEAGRDRWSLYATGPHELARLEARLSWVDRIRDALERDDFVLHAQPITNLTTGEVTQYELLVRMRGSDGELIPPASFLHIAERYDLVQELDCWVLGQAIEMLGRARRAGRPLTLEVNLSGRSLGHPRVLRTIEQELARTGAHPRDLILEITETAAVSNIPQAQAFGQRLSELGCRFALDDFGAGFGSFYYLKHLPFDMLKIDGEFIRNCCEDPTDRLIIQALVDVARGMGKQSIAEFVGDAPTARLLREYGVDLGQGYHFGRPAALHELLPLAAVA